MVIGIALGCFINGGMKSEKLEKREKTGFCDFFSEINF